MPKLQRFSFFEVNLEYRVHSCLSQPEACLFFDRVVFELFSIGVQIQPAECAPVRLTGGSIAYERAGVGKFYPHVRFVPTDYGVRMMKNNTHAPRSGLSVVPQHRSFRRFVRKLFASFLRHQGADFQDGLREEVMRKLRDIEALITREMARQAKRGK
jgi:hypothetical protein